MLITAPISTDSIAVRACPCEEINMLSPSASCTKIVPKMIDGNIIYCICNGLVTGSEQN